MGVINLFSKWLISCEHTAEGLECNCNSDEEIARRMLKDGIGYDDPLFPKNTFVYLERHQNAHKTNF